MDANIAILGRIPAFLTGNVNKKGIVIYHK